MPPRPRRCSAVRFLDDPSTHPSTPPTNWALAQAECNFYTVARRNPCAEFTHNNRALLPLSKPTRPPRSGECISQTRATHALQQCLAIRAAVAQLVARRSHNPKVVSSILTCRIFGGNTLPQAMATLYRSNLATLQLHSRSGGRD